MAFIKKNLAFFLINILISAVTVLAVLFLWDQFQNKRLEQQATPAQSLSQPIKSDENVEPGVKATNADAKPFASGDISVSISLVSGMGELKLEYILIKNDGANKISLLDWSIKGSEPQNIIIKSDILLNPGGAIKIYTKEGTDSALAIYLDSKKALWKSGSSVTLLDPAQTERASYTIP